MADAVTFNKMRKINILVSGVILLSFATGIYFYPQVPEKMASHWNARGEVNGYLSKFWGLFLIPFVSSALFLFFLLIPKIDPLGENIEEFREYYDGFIVLFVLFLSYIHILTLLWNLGYRFDMGQAIIPSLGFLFFYLGILMENAQRNWFIGIRTPWTLSSEDVWDKTHKLGGKLFKVAGVIAVLGIFFKDYALLFLLAPILGFTIYLVIYSYFEYQKLARSH